MIPTEASIERVLRHECKHYAMSLDVDLKTRPMHSCAYFPKLKTCRKFFGNAIRVTAKYDNNTYTLPPSLFVNWDPGF